MHPKQKLFETLSQNTAALRTPYHLNAHHRAAPLPRIRCRQRHARNMRACGRENQKQVLPSSIYGAGVFI
jgi:hypothetical protein